MEKAAGRAQGAHSTETSRPEAVFVLLLTQSIFWMVAGISALPFALGGALHMIGLGLATLAAALRVCLVAIGVLWRPRWARRTPRGLEIVGLAAPARRHGLPTRASHAPDA